MIASAVARTWRGSGPGGWRDPRAIASAQAAESRAVREELQAGRDDRDDPAGLEASLAAEAEAAAAGLLAAARREAATEAEGDIYAARRILARTQAEAARRCAGSAGRRSGGPSAVTKTAVWGQRGAPGGRVLGGRRRLASCFPRRAVATRPADVPGGWPVVGQRGQEPVGVTTQRAQAGAQESVHLPAACPEGGQGIVVLAWLGPEGTGEPVTTHGHDPHILACQLSTHEGSIQTGKPIYRGGPG